MLISCKEQKNLKGNVVFIFDRILYYFIRCIESEDDMNYYSPCQIGDIICRRIAFVQENNFLGKVPYKEEIINKDSKILILQIES